MTHLVWRALLICVASLAIPAVAAGHGDPAGRPSAVGKGGAAVQLRGCFLTAAFMPRPPSALQPVLDKPLDLTTTFYGPDPLLGVWGMSCDGSRVGGQRAGKLVLALVGVPVGLTSAGAVPLANNFAHRLIRIDTSSRRVAVAARRAGLPATYAGRMRYRHARPGILPLRGLLSVPGGYALDVRASLADPTNPHDHANLFEHRAQGRTATLTLSIQDAFDRFCLEPNETCSGSVRAPAGSVLARLLGGRSAGARAAFDHDKLDRADIRLRGGPA